MAKKLFGLIILLVLLSLSNQFKVSAQYYSPFGAYAYPQYYSIYGYDEVIGYETDIREVLFERPIFENNLEVPGISEIEKSFYSDSSYNEWSIKNIGLNVRSSLLGLSVCPEYKISNFKISLNIPLKYNRKPKIVFGNLMLSVEHRTLQNNMIWTKKLSLVLPSNHNTGTGSTIPSYTNSFDYILSTGFLTRNEKHGYYGNAFFRISGNRKQTYILDYEYSSNYENWMFTTNHGTYSAFDINTYVMPHENFAWHFGFFLRFNSKGWNKSEVYTSWNNQTSSLEAVSNENRFVDTGFRTAIVATGEKLDIKAAICYNPFYDGVDNGLFGGPISLNISLNYKFSYEK